MKHFQINDSKGNKVSANLTGECINCYENCSNIGLLVNSCPRYGGSRRQGKINNNQSSTFLCCDTTKTTKLFREKLEALSYAFPDLTVPQKEIEENIKKSEQQKVNRLVHNLTSINAHNIQEIYDLVPQEILSLNWVNQLNYIEKEIKKNPKKAAMMYLRIAKHNIHMKSEFSIYRKLDREDSASLEFRNYPIRNVLLNVLHTFFADFTNNDIYVRVADFTGKVKIDYETIQVAIYHLIENASKYARHSSTISITFEELKSETKVRFARISAYIQPSEREMIFNEGYSGEIAKRMQKHGDGIGMWRIRQMMELNQGSCTVICGDEKQEISGFDYSTNTFILTFKPAK